jgi:hypothetical protein
MLSPATKPPSGLAASHSLCRPGRRVRHSGPRIQYQQSSNWGTNCGTTPSTSRPRVSLVPVRDLAYRRFSTSLPHLFAGLPVFDLRTCCSTYCGPRCGSRCLSSGCRVSLMAVRDSGGRAVLRFGKDTVREMLCNAAYAGYVSGLRDKSRTIKGLHQPIVTDELFDPRAEVRGWRTRVVKPGPPSYEYLPRKLLRCERCGARMHGTRGSKTAVVLHPGRVPFPG